MRVRDLMTEDVVTVDVEASLHDAAGLMLKNRIGSIIVTEEGVPEGILTERDALDAGYRGRRSFEKIPVRKIMSTPLKTVPSDTGIPAAIHEMTIYSIKKLPVIDGLDLVGIVTTTDIITHLNEIRKEARDLTSKGGKW